MKSFAAILVACLFLGACGPSETKKEAPAEKKAQSTQAPDLFRVNLDTSKGAVVVEVHRDWAPRGVDQFYTLVKTGFYDNARFFRVRPKFVVQFGIAGDPKKNRLWQNTPLPDDPVKESNTRGMLTYATAGPNTRTTQVFINLADNRRLDKQGFAPIGKVVSGMDAVDAFYSFYGEMGPNGPGPDPQEIEHRGNDYLESKFPRLDFIKKAVIE